MLTISIIVSVCKGTTFLSRFQVFSFEGSVKICKQKYGLIGGVSNVSNVFLVFLKMHIYREKKLKKSRSLYIIELN